LELLHLRACSSKLVALIGGDVRRREHAGALLAVDGDAA